MAGISTKKVKPESEKFAEEAVSGNKINSRKPKPLLCLPLDKAIG